MAGAVAVHKPRFAEIAKRYETSMDTPRESLSRLVQEGLIVLEPNRGFCVRPRRRAWTSARRKSSISSLGMPVVVIGARADPAAA